MENSQTFINADEFMQMLAEKNLVIGRAEDFETVRQIRLDQLRKRYMKRISLTIKEILDAQLLPLNSRTSVEHWIASGKIKPSEVIVEASGKRKRLILTSAIIRLGYGN